MRTTVILALCLFASACFADLMISDCDDAAQWGKSALPEAQQVKQGKGAVRWEFAQGSDIGLSNLPHDWTKAGNALSFWLYCPKATGSPFYVIIGSENRAVEGSDYYLSLIHI